MINEVLKKWGCLGIVAKYDYLYACNPYTWMAHEHPINVLLRLCLCRGEAFFAPICNF